MKLSLGLTPRDYSVAGGAVAYDADAQAYFTANTAIISDADKNAINTFYLGLKSDGIYTKIKAMYLPIWGSAASSKWNLVNPADTNAAFRLTFSTGFTYSSSGVTPSVAFANTFFTPSVNGTLNSSHVSFYSRTNVDQSSIDIGANNALGTAGATMLYTRTTNALYGVIDYYPPTGADYITGAVTDSRGHFLLSRTASNLSKAFKNGSVLGTKASVGNRSSKQITISALNKDNPDGQANYSTRQWSFASIGDGLTDAEATNFYNRVNTLMTYFGINV